MNHCKSCKYWRQIKIAIRISYNVHDKDKKTPMFYETNRGKKIFLPFGTCKSRRTVYGDGYWISNATGKVRLASKKALYYMDSEAYSASLMVGEEYGCANWKDKQ